MNIAVKTLKLLETAKRESRTKKKSSKNKAKAHYMTI